MRNELDTWLLLFRIFHRTDINNNIDLFRYSFANWLICKNNFRYSRDYWLYEKEISLRYK